MAAIPPPAELRATADGRHACYGNTNAPRHANHGGVSITVTPIKSREWSIIKARLTTSHYARVNANVDCNADGPQTWTIASISTGMMETASKKEMKIRRKKWVGIYGCSWFPS